MCRHSKPRVVHEGGRPITGLAFKSSGKDVYLFVVTEVNVCSINISNKDMKVGEMERMERVLVEVEAGWGGKGCRICFKGWN